jgi:hypothetical protein
MLTYNDLTVPKAVEVFKEIQDTEVTHARARVFTIGTAILKKKSVSDVNLMDQVIAAIREVERSIKRSK